MRELLELAANYIVKNADGYDKVCLSNRGYHMNRSFNHFFGSKSGE